MRRLRGDLGRPTQTPTRHYPNPLSYPQEENSYTHGNIIPDTIDT